MDDPAVKPSLRRYGLRGLIVLAFVLVSSVVYVVVSDDAMIDSGEAFPEQVIIDPEKQPRFIFPDELRTYDLSLNCFIDRFFRICAEGKYSEFRLMLSSTAGDPVVPKRFESMFNALKEARILSIDRLPEIPSAEGPIYVLTAEYDLEDYAAKRIKTGNLTRLAIRQEEGEWCIGPIPKALQEVRPDLDRAAQATRPENSESIISQANANPRESGDTQSSTATANRPAHLPP